MATGRVVMNAKALRSALPVRRLRPIDRDMRYLVAAIATVALVWTAASTPALAGDGTRQYVLGIEGMACPISCAPAVQKSLEGVDGVDSVEVKFEEQQAVVNMAPGKSLTRETCDGAFGNSGYSITSFAEADGAAPSGG